MLQAGGAVDAVSTLLADNGAVDYSGAIDATDCLIQAAPATDTIKGSGNLIGVDPELASSGLADNGGPTQTVALQPASPAIGAGSNPQHFATDQRGYGPRTGPGGTDIGAIQHDAGAETKAPTAALAAVDVTSSDAPDPYAFSVTFSSEFAIEASTLPGALVQVTPSGGGTPITASVVSTAPVGPTDPAGNAASIVVTYDFTPPGGSWTAADDGTYTVALSGTPVTDLAGEAVAVGTLGSFAVNIPSSTRMVITAGPATSSPITAGSEFTVTIAMENSQGQVQTGATGMVTIALASGPSGPSLGGTLTLPVSQGIATFDDLTLDQAAVGYELRATASGLAPVSTSAFGVAPAAASQLVVIAQPPSSVTAGQPFGLGVTVEDRFGNVETGYTGSVTVAISTNPGAAKLGGTLTAAVDQGIATFTGLTLDQPGTGYILQATAPNLPAVTTAALDVTAPAGGQTNRNAPTQMVVTLRAVEREHDQGGIAIHGDHRTGEQPGPGADRSHRHGHDRPGLRSWRRDARRNAHRRRQPGHRHVRRPDARTGRGRVYDPGDIREAARRHDHRIQRGRCDDDEPSSWRQRGVPAGRREWRGIPAWHWQPERGLAKHQFDTRRRADWRLIDERKRINKHRDELNSRFRREQPWQGQVETQAPPREEGGPVEFEHPQAAVAPPWPPVEDEVAPCGIRGPRRPGRYPISPAAPAKTDISAVQRMLGLRFRLKARPGSHALTARERLCTESCDRCA